MSGATPFSFQLPATVMVFGLQGSGKTTTIAKMARYMHKQAERRGKKRQILVASVDFYRPAAIDQLEVLAQQVGALFYRPTESSPVKAALAIQEYAKGHSIELLFLDTAGRFHIDNQMLDELKQLAQAIQPRYKIMVLDAMTGQESLNVAQAFDQAIGYQYAILSKMDSEVRGGAAFSFRYAQKKPILFIGSGEKIDDLEQFHPDRVAGTILGMGDVVSLAERAQTCIKQSEQDAMEKAFQRGNLTLQDFANQLGVLDRMGSLTQIMHYLPGLGSTISAQMLTEGENTMKRFRAIISSMTPKERNNYKLLDASRKGRIAKGAGVTIKDIDCLLERFEESQQYVKLFKKFGRNNRLFR
jgi:signal recognition particle subunit SRP54